MLVKLYALFQRNKSDEKTSQFFSLIFCQFQLNFIAHLCLDF